jgi:ribosomal-protein-alanine N-acetyltransferase
MSEPDYRHISLLWAGPEQASELAELHKGLFPDAWDAAAFEKLLAHPGSIAFMARLGTPPHTAGFILGTIAADEAEVLTLGVRADRQRHGVGRRLVEALVRAARKSDVRRLFLEVGVSNTSALGLYRATGFSQVAVRKGYYERAGAPAGDACVLSLTL